MAKCLVYIDLNMVRAGVVEHPSEWGFSGYNEIQKPRERYALIDYEGLKDLLGFKGMDDLCRWLSRMGGGISEGVGAVPGREMDGECGGWQ